MSQKKEIAIQSAQTVSVLRAVSSRETEPALRSGDYLASHFLNTKFRLMVNLLPHGFVKKWIQLVSPGSYCMLVIRTRHFDQVLLKAVQDGVQQVVILGAGYDTRAFRFAEKLKNIPVFEVDFPGTQQYKRKKLEKLYSEVPSFIRYIPLDFNETPFEDALLDNGFSTNLKTLFLWEGVSYYLPENVVRNVLKFVSACAYGSSILFDYSTRDFVQGDLGSYGGKQLADWLKRIREPFLFGLNATETKDFIHSCRLSIVSDYGPGELENMYLRTMRGKKAGQILGHIRMVHASVSGSLS
jgi:methyltransferase (TIGR00027 family)